MGARRGGAAITAGKVPADKLALYERLVATQPGVQRKGATIPYTSLNGHMFSFLTKEGKLALRLPPAERAAFVEEHRTGPVVQYGAVMAEYVEVPDVLLKDTQALSAHFARSRAYVASLKPKPTTRKKKAASKPRKRK